MKKWLASVVQHTEELGIRSLTANCRSTDIPYDLTVGDWDTRFFSFPEPLSKAVAHYYAVGATDYADIAGVGALRAIVASLWQTYTTLSYQASNVIIASGTRPLLYLACHTILEQKDWVAYSTPSWNTGHYLQNLTSHTINIDTDAANGFLPQLSQLASLRKQLNLLWLNLPLNPSGYCYRLPEWTQLLQWIEQVNLERELADLKPLFVVVDAVYHRLNSGTAPLWQQLAHCPKLKNYCLFIDGIAKCYVATGIRVGWAVGPQFWIQAMVRYNGYLGSWAAKPEQLALADYLSYPSATTYIEELRSQLEQRAQCWQAVIEELTNMGYPVTMLPYYGGLYLSVHLPLANYHDSSNTTIETADQLFCYLVKIAGLAMVSFKYLDAPKHQWWFRVALGRGSIKQYQSAATALKHAIIRLHQ